MDTHEPNADTHAARTANPEAGAQPRGRGTVIDALLSVRWTCLGILCGHVWSWGAVHAASMAFPGLHPSMFVYLALSGMLLLVTAWALLAHPSERLASRLDVPVAMAAAAGTLLLCAPIPSADPQAQVICGAVLGGIGIGGSYLQWSFFYSRLSSREVVTCVFGAMIVGSLVKIPIDLLPPVPCAVACALLCVASPILKRDAVAHQLARSEAEPAEHASQPVYTTWASVRPLVKTFLGVVAYSLVIGLMQGMTVTASPMPKLVLSGVHHLLEVVVAAGVIWYALGSRHAGMSVPGIWKAVLVFTGAGVMALPLVGPVFSGWALIAVAVAQTLVVMLLWAMLAEVARRCSASPLAVFALGWTTYSLPFSLGWLVGSALDTVGWGTSVVGLIVYLLALSTLFFLNERDFSRNRMFADLEAPAPAASSAAPLRDACHEVGRAGELTEREEEVMYLICMGRSKGYIAENLSISENTVRSHSRHLYAKLDVHSKQELLDLVLAKAGEAQA